MAHVLLPCDLPFWPDILLSLFQVKTTKDTRQLIQLMTHIHHISCVSLDPEEEDVPQPKLFQELDRFLKDEFTNDERCHFMHQTLPFIASSASQLSHLKPHDGFFYSLCLEDNEFHLEREMVTSLLANAFFSTFPRRNSKTHPTLQDFNFVHFFPHLHKHSHRQKLKAFFHYFEKLKNKGGHISVKRKVANGASLATWLCCNQPLGAFSVRKNNNLTQDMQVYTTSSMIGGGVLKTSSSEESELFFKYPELIVILCFVENLSESEVLIVKGIAQDNSDTPDLNFCFADFVPSHRLEEQTLLQELNKASAAFWAEDQHSDSCSDEIFALGSLSKRSSQDASRSFSRSETSESISKRSSRDASLNLSKRSSQDTSLDLSKILLMDVSRSISNRLSQESSLNLSKRSSHDASANLSKRSSQDASANLSKRSSQDASANLSKRSSQDASANLSKRSSQDASANLFKRSSQDASANLSKRSSQDASDNLSKRSSHESSWNSSRRHSHEGSNRRRSHEAHPSSHSKKSHDFHHSASLDSKDKYSKEDSIDEKAKQTKTHLRKRFSDTKKHSSSKGSSHSSGRSMKTALREDESYYTADDDSEDGGGGWSFRSDSVGFVLGEHEKLDDFRKRIRKRTRRLRKRSSYMSSSSDMEDISEENPEEVRYIRAATSEPSLVSQINEESPLCQEAEALILRGRKKIMMTSSNGRLKAYSYDGVNPNLPVPFKAKFRRRTNDESPIESLADRNKVVVSDEMGCLRVMILWLAATVSETEICVVCSSEESMLQTSRIHSKIVSRKWTIGDLCSEILRLCRNSSSSSESKESIFLEELFRD